MPGCSAPEPSAVPACSPYGLNLHHVFGFGHILANPDFGFSHNMAKAETGFDQSERGATMQRNAMEDLVAWKDAPDRKPLVVNGARQVGKTWLVLEFGRRYFDEVAHVVFLDNEAMRQVFEGSLEPDRLLTLIGASTGTNPKSGRTLVFLDEIQECPRAITSLKLFCEQRPEIPVVAAGSLLGVALNRGAQGAPRASWPVGKVNYLDLHPLSFDEYVRAVGSEQLYELLRDGEVDMVGALGERYVDLLRTYLYVGGMPEAVRTYVSTGDLSAARRVQTELLVGYERDFSKHVDTALEAERIRQTWRSVPIQLARETDMRRFTYASISPGSRGRDYRDAVAWLVDAGLVTKVPKVSKPGVPLAAYEDETYFKLYLLDVGLLGALTSLGASALVDGDRLFTEYKGVYAEQYVCQQLVASNACRPRYWSADGKRTKGEVDFIAEFEGRVLPIEVKAGQSVHGSSLAAFVRRYDLPRAVRFSMRDASDEGWLLNLPLYMANLLPQML